VSGFSGLGFVFREGGGIAGIDLDHVIGEDGQIEPWAERTVLAFDSYTEVSVSGQGLHIICLGSIPDGRGRRRERCEIYNRSRYFTMSGQVYGEARPLRDAQGAIDRLLRWMTREELERQPARRYHAAPCTDDRKLLHAAASSRNGLKFARLWRGDASDYGGDDSRADLALLSMLMFWTRGDESRTDALFRQSGLMRDKWGRRADYRRRCFERVMR
jgi:putative DNA primase/helicase